MITRLFLPLVLMAVGAYILLSALAGAGFPVSGLFSDGADKIRAEAELKRVDVELLKAVHDYEERKVLIAAATEPRTPALVMFCMILLAVLCGAFFIALVIMFMRERERRRFAEYREKIILKKPRREALQKSDRAELPPGRLCIDERDRERGAV